MKCFCKTRTKMCELIDCSRFLIKLILLCGTNIIIMEIANEINFQISICLFDGFLVMHCEEMKYWLSASIILISVNIFWGFMKDLIKYVYFIIVYNESHLMNNDRSYLIYEDMISDQTNLISINWCCIIELFNK